MDPQPLPPAPADIAKKPLLIAGALLAALLLSVMFSAPKSFPVGGIYTIPSGTSLKSVAEGMKEESYIRSTVLFSTLVTIFGGERNLSSGGYYFDRPASVVSVAWQVARGRHNLEPVKITVPEGKNVREISQILSEKLPGFPSAEFKELADPAEGYLFPDTYFIYPKADPKSVFSEMRAMFDTQAGPLLAELPVGRTEKEVVIVASLIEREARGDDDRATIAGILYRRLSLDMPLQVDASVAFARGIPEGDIKKADLSYDSPYNTYVYRGLPPGPIANPGKEALLAAISPKKTDYLYYIHDRRGSIHYAKTYPEHQRNIARYLK